MEPNTTGTNSLLEDVRKQGALDVSNRMALDKAVQDACPHIKPNLKPCIGGQRINNTETYIFVCGYCQKEWNEETLPVHLRINSEQVGGLVSVTSVSLKEEKPLLRIVEKQAEVLPVDYVKEFTEIEETITAFEEKARRLDEVSEKY